MGLICTKPEVSTKSVNEGVKEELVVVKEEVAAVKEELAAKEEVTKAESVNTDPVQLDQISKVLSHYKTHYDHHLIIFQEILCRSRLLLGN